MTRRLPSFAANVPFVRDIESEPGLGCFWKFGLVFQDSEGNFVEITKASGLSKTRLHHLHFDTTDLDASVNFYRKFSTAPLKSKVTVMQRSQYRRGNAWCSIESASSAK